MGMNDPLQGGYLSCSRASEAVTVRTLAAQTSRKYGARNWHADVHIEFDQNETLQPVCGAHASRREGCGR